MTDRDVTERDIPRRKFIGGLAAASAALAGAPLLKQINPEFFRPMSWPPGSWDIVFLQDWLFSDAAVDLSGCRRNSGPTAGYLNPSVPKATVPPDVNPVRLHFPGNKGAVITPIP